MEEKPEHDASCPGCEPGNGEKKDTGGFFPSLIDIFLDPAKVFRRIDAGLQWWKAYIVLAVIYAAVSWFGLPLQLHLARLNENGLSEERLQATLDGMERFGWIGVIFAPIGMLLVLLLIAAITNLIINIVSTRSGFKKVLSLMCFTGLIGALEQIINTIVIHARGIEGIESRADSIVSIGPLALMPDAEGMMAALLQTLSVFQIWDFVVFTLGVAAIFRISWKKALVPTVILWILGFAAAAIGRKMSGMG